MMSKVIEVMEKQLGIELKSASEKLTSSNLDTIFKLTTSIHNLECMRDGTWNNAPVFQEKTAVSDHSNGKYDHNIDHLYESYIAVKKSYQKSGSDQSKAKLIEAVGVLMAEVYDMVHEMIENSDTADERQEIQRQIKKLFGV